jgi:hypothetical protein
MSNLIHESTRNIYRIWSISRFFGAMSSYGWSDRHRIYDFTDTLSQVR